MNILREILNLEGKEDQTLKRQDELRKHVKGVMPCDACADPPLLVPGYKGPCIQHQYSIKQTYKGGDCNFPIKWLWLLWDVYITGWMDGQMDELDAGWIDGLPDGLMSRWMDGWMDYWMNGWTDE